MGNLKGISGEFMAMSDALEKGYIVAKIPEVGSHFNMYDFVLDDGVKLFRVEVKTSDYREKTRSQNCVEFKLRRKNGLKYNVDCFALVCLKISKVAWIPADNIKNKRRHTILYKEFDYHQLPDNSLIEETNKQKEVVKQLSLFNNTLKTKRGT